MIFNPSVKKLRLDAFHGIFLQIYLSMTVSLTTMSDGISVGWSSSKIAEMTNDSANSTVKITLEQASFIGTLPTYVCSLILPLAIYSSNHIGRKWTIIWGAFCTFTSWYFLIYAEKIEYIYTGVILRGFGGFIIYSITQIYIAEIAQANIRGFLGTLIPILMNLGILLSYICITYTSLQNLAIFGTIVVGIMFPMFLFAPKSPYFLFMKNKPEEARSSLKKLRKKNVDIQYELEDIKVTIEKNNLEKTSIKEFFSDKICRKVSIIVLSVQAFQQLSGIDAILLFLQVILQSSGSSLSSNFSSIIIGTGKFTACGISVMTVDKIGRRSLLIFSCMVSSFALAMMGFYFYIKDVAKYDVTSVSWIPLTVLMIYVLGYNIGLGTVPFLLASEMYPTKYKAFGVAAVQVMYCVSMVSVTQLFAWMKDSYGFHLAFWFLSAMTFVGMLFSIYNVCETKNKTLKQILIELE